MRLGFALAVAIGLAGSPVLGQDVPEGAPSIEPLALEFDAAGLSGPGGELLASHLPEMQFVMIGEDHGYADAPRLVSAFAAEGKEHGFDDYAIEVGPYSTAWLRDVLSEGGPDALAAQLEGRPLAIPFLSNREEAETAMAFLGEGQLWGSDQEFIASPLIHLEILGEGSDAEILSVLSMREREAFATGNQAAAFMASVTDEEWAALELAFADDEVALDRLLQLRRSTQVYRSYMAGRGLDNNLDRVELIKEYFLAAYHRAEERKGMPPRVLMKFGAVHASRATTPMSTFDLGPMIEGMAAANGLDALHIAYLPMGGEQIAIRPSADGFFSVKATDGSMLRAVLEKAGVNVAKIENGSGHFVIPMEPVKRALRNGGLGELDRMSRSFVLGFDYIVTTMEAKPATPLGQR